MTFCHSRACVCVCMAFATSSERRCVCVWPLVAVAGGPGTYMVEYGGEGFSFNTPLCRWPGKVPPNFPPHAPACFRALPVIQEMSRN